MPNLIFHPSTPLTLGMELELQLIDPNTRQLIARAKDLIRNIQDSKFQQQIKPEVTQGMIELNSLVHKTPHALLDDLFRIGTFLQKQSKQLNIQICGGGAHPLQKWHENKIFPIRRFKNLYWQYRYLSKNFTIFALHLHIGCQNGDNALYLTHLLSRYVPQFIALSGSSPFYQGIDTGFTSSRLNIVGGFPTSGHIPFLTDWREFSEFYFKLKKINVIRSMKDIYWDIRPKPTFGTVEIRIFDMPLTLHHAVTLAAYVQTLTHFLWDNRLPMIKDLYTVYPYNRFQACRFGFDGKFIDPYTLKSRSIQDDILLTIEQLKPSAHELNNTRYLKTIKSLTTKKLNDSARLKKIWTKTNSFEKTIREQCRLWQEQF